MLSKLIKKILKEPLLQFLIAGALLYFVYTLIHHSDQKQTAQQNTIVVNHAIIKSLAGIQSKLPVQSEELDKLVKSLKPNEIDSLVSQYATDEALYREALLWGLDQNDYILKKRLIQKILFIIEDLNTTNIHISPAQVKAYYNAHKKNYMSIPRITFTHIYFSQDQFHDKALTIANKVKAQLNRAKRGGNAALSVGNRFPLKRIYADATPSEIDSHFGYAFTKQIFQYQVAKKWQGPIHSGFGYHLVYITYKAQPTYLTFDQVKSKIKDQLIYDELQRRNKAAIKSITDKYSIIRDY